MANTDGEIIYTLRGDDSQLEGDLSRGEKTAKSHGEKLKNISAGAAKAVGTGMMAAGAAAAGIGIAAVNSANNLDKAMNQFTASTGVGTEHTERYKKLMEDVYANNYGESFEDVADAMSQVRQQIGPVVDSWDDKGIQDFTESTFALRDTFGIDIQESTRAASTLMEQFGLDGAAAMDLITAGTQNGLDFSGEFLDGINEYSVHFEKIGLDADDMFKILQKGSDSGAFNLDKIGDAVKELSIKVIDGSDATKEGFGTIGLNADEMAAKFAAGGDSAKEAFQQTIDALAGIDDPLAQNAAGVALFGTTWEDLGADAVTALADIDEGMYGTGGEMEKLKEIKYDDIGSVFEGLKRSIEVLIIPLGEQLIPLLTDLVKDALPLIEEHLPPLIEMIAGFAEQLMPIAEEILPVLLETIVSLGEPLMQLIEEILPVILELFSQVAPLLGELIEAVLPILVELFQALLPPLMEIIGALLPPLISLINALLPIFEVLIGLLQPIIELFMGLLDPIVQLIEGAIIPMVEALKPLIDIIQAVLTPVLEALGELFDSIFQGIFDTVGEVIGNVTNILKGIVDFIKCVFTGDWEGAWDAIVNIFDNLISGIANIFKIPINLIIDGINWFIDGINSIEIPEWVPLVGGFGFSIPNIPRLKVGMDYVPSDFFPAYLDEGEAVLTKQENAMYRELGGVQGMLGQMSMYSARQAVQSAAGQDIDYERLAKGTANAMAKTIEGMGVYLDKKPVGKIIAPSINEELGKIERRKT